MKRNFTHQDFKDLLVPNGECLEWSMARQIKGYGVTKIKGRQYTTHRLSYELEYGPIPKDMYVCHKCDNPICCNPEHLFLGTHQDNMTDRHAKGRTYIVKLSEQKIHEIRDLASTSMTQKDIGDMYDISPTMVRLIKNRERWQHI